MIGVGEDNNNCITDDIWDDENAGVYKMLSLKVEGRESMEGWQIKKLRKGECREGKDWNSLPLHIHITLSKIREFFINNFPQ